VREGIMNTKTYIRRSVFLIGSLLALLLSTNLAYSVVLDDVKGARLERQDTPPYAPGEIIIKLKKKETLKTLSTQSYSTRQLSDSESLSRIKTKYGLGDEKPVFQGLHNQLKTKTSNLKRSLNTLDKRSLGKQSLDKQSQVQSAKKVDLFPIYILKTNRDAAEVAKELSKDPDVEYAEPNYIRTAQVVPNDLYYSSSGSWGQSYDDLWGIKKIRCEEAWDVSQGSGVIVAVIDSGVDYTHEDLVENIWTNQAELDGIDGVDDDGNGYIDDIHGYDFANEDGDPMDGHGHGTHCAGTIAARGNNNIGVIGVAPMAKIMAIKGLSDTGSGHDGGLAASVKYAADNGADVISNSWGGPFGSDLLTDAFNYAHNQGCVSLAAAGNESMNVSYITPASIDTVIAVAATTHNDEKCSFSNYGLLIDVAAPGGGYDNEFGGGRNDIYNILSTMPDDNGLGEKRADLKVSDGYWRIAGTSMACPHAAGLAALIKSLYPEDSPDAIRSRIIEGADNIDSLNPVFEGLLGSGRINAYGSLTVDPKRLLKIKDIETDNISHGSNGTIIIHLRNFWQETFGVAAVLSTQHPQITVQNGHAVFGDILSGQTKTNSENPFIISIDQNIPYGEIIDFDLTVTAEGGYREVFNFTLSIAFFENVGRQTNLPLNSFLSISTVMRDYNRDGYPDLFFVGWSGGDLYRNCRDGSFIKATDEAGVNDGVMPWTSLFMDIDNDGFQDLLIGSGAIGIDSDNKLFLNSGSGTFSDISDESGISSAGCLYAGLALDYDNDGFLDIFGGRSLLRNNGNNTFTDIIEKTVLPQRGALDQGVCFDYDNDNDQDLLFALGQGDALYLCRNDGNGMFADVTVSAGIDASRGGAVGFAAGDYDNDGDIDIFLSGLTYPDDDLNVNALYRNNGNGTFTDVTKEAGVTGSMFMGSWWGSDFFDYDNDGDLDLYVTDCAFMRNTLYRNDGDGTFTYVTDRGFPEGINPGSGVACIADYNNDGALDIYAPAGTGGTGALFKNLVGIKNNWIKINLEGTTSNRDAYGARVYVKTGDSPTQLREVHTGSVETQPLHFGLGKASLINEIKIYWPSGSVQTLYDISVNQTINIVEVLNNDIPHISSVSPSSAFVGDTITITGLNFGPSQGSGYVEFSRDIAAVQILSWSNTEVVCEVPFGAMSGTIYLVTEAKRSMGYHFTVLNVNNPPVFDPINDKTVVVGIPMWFKVTATDPDGNTLTYKSWPWSQDGPTFIDQIFRWTPDHIGHRTVYFKVTDGEQEVKSASVKITVVEKNSPPELDDIGNKEVYEGGLLEFIVTATDPEGDSIILSAKRLPEGATFNNGLFRWAPDYGQAGTYEITFKAEDVTANSLTDTETITITVNPSSRKPFIVSIDPDSGMIGDTITITGRNFDTYVSKENYNPVCDLDHDGDVDMRDFLTFRRTFVPAFGSSTGDLNYNPVCDLDHDGNVGMLDFGVFRRALFSSRGENYVEFYYGIEARILSWSDTQITCEAPYGIASGSVHVITEEGMSNNVFFILEE